MLCRIEQEIIVVLGGTAWHRANQKKPPTLRLPVGILQTSAVILTRDGDRNNFVGEIGQVRFGMACGVHR
jgi:hypothetical protein